MYTGSLGYLLYFKRLFFKNKVDFKNHLRYSENKIL